MAWGEKLGAEAGADGMDKPSNLGSGAAKQTLAPSTSRAVETHTPKGKLRGGVSARLVVADETQHLAEAGHGQQAAVLRVCNLPYFAQYCRRELGALEEFDGNLACYYAELLCVGLLEEILEDALLFWCEVEDGLVCACLARALEETTRGGATTYSIRRLLRGPPWLCNSRWWSSWW